MKWKNGKTEKPNHRATILIRREINAYSWQKGQDESFFEYINGTYYADDNYVLDVNAEAWGIDFFDWVELPENRKCRIKVCERTRAHENIIRKAWNQREQLRVEIIHTVLDGNLSTMNKIMREQNKNMIGQYVKKTT
jgi:hypothetical protein